MKSLESEGEIDQFLVVNSEHLDLASYRGVLADVRRDFLRVIGRENLAEAEDCTKRWKALQERNPKNIRTGRARIISQAQLALSQAEKGAYKEATGNFEQAVDIWRAMQGNLIFGSGTVTEEAVIEIGVEIMSRCTPGNPELTLRLVQECTPIFDYIITKVHLKRAVEGFIPPELWPVYADGRKYEARANLALGNLDQAWSSFSGCSGRLGELVKMHPDDPEPLIKRCELVAEWSKMPSPPREPDHPNRVVDFLKKIISSAEAMNLSPEQQSRLDQVRPAPTIR